MMCTQPHSWAFMLTVSYPPERSLFQSIPTSMLCCIVLFLNAADTDLKPSPLLFQRYLMHRMLVDERAHQPVFWRTNLIQAESDPEDECRWRGVGCDATIVIQIMLHSKLTHDYPVNLNMLPSSVRYIHARHVALATQWRVASLPRELLYIFLTDVYFQGRGRCKNKQHSLDVHKMPHKVEEFIAIRARVTGPLFIQDLPESLRLCCVQDFACMQICMHILHADTFVDLQAIPVKLE